MNEGVRNLIENVIPTRWKALVDHMTLEEKITWSRNPKSRFEHCVIRSTGQKSRWIPLRKSTYRDVYQLLVKRATENIRFNGPLEGPRQTLSALLGRSVPYNEMWKEVRRYERNPKGDDLLWRLLHARVKVGVEIDWLSLEKKSCPTCGRNTGTEVPLTLAHV